MENAPAIVKSYVNVGSMNEPENIKGISHFLEHMAFNGTNGNDGHIKLNQGDSFLKVDEMGGWIKKGWKTAGKTPVKNVELWQRLLKAKEPHKVDFVWVKGHAGHDYNERCDTLAVTASKGPNLKTKVS